MRRVLIALVLAASANLARAQTKPTPPSQEPKPVTPEEIQRLRREIETETRSRFELLFDGHTEEGDSNNQLRFLRLGGRLSLERGEATTLHVTAQHVPYTTPDEMVERSGASLTIGAETRRSDRVAYEWEAGAVRFSNDRWDGTGLVNVTVRSSDKRRYALGVRRSLVEESMLSAVGLEPVVGPFGGQRVGGVTDNRLMAGGTWQLPWHFDLVAEGALGVYAGTNVGENFFKRAGGGPAWNAIARAPEASLSFLRVGIWIEYFGFDEDRLGYGGASLLDAEGQTVPLSELGSDGIPPEPDPPHPGVGGYFSPKSFTSVVGRVEVRGRPSPRLDYSLAAVLGTQTYTGSDRSAVGGLAAQVTLRLGERLSLPLSYQWDNYGPFTQQTLKARLVIPF
jgi:hypothetical protein